MVKKAGSYIYHRGYLGKTVRLDSLLDDLYHEEMKEALKQFKGLPLVNNLKMVNQAFEALYREKINDEAENGILRKNDAKEIVEYYLSILFGHIGYCALKNGSTHSSLVEKLNEIIEDVTAVARARKTREENHVADDNDDSGAVENE